MEHNPYWETGQFSANHKFLAFYETRKFITSFTSTRHLSLSWARSIQSMFVLLGTVSYSTHIFHNINNEMYFFVNKFSLKIAVTVLNMCEKYINTCPTSCNTKQSIYYSASSLYMFRVSTTPIIRSTQNCNYSLRYSAATSLQRGQACPRWREVAAQHSMTGTGGCI